MGPDISEFAAFDRYDPKIRSALESAENLVRTNPHQPHLSLLEGRRFLEALTMQIAVYNGLNASEQTNGMKESLDARIGRLLKLGHIPKQQRQNFYGAKELCNLGVHVNEPGSRQPTLEDAKRALILSKRLAQWYLTVVVVVNIRDLDKVNPPPPPPPPPPRPTIYAFVARPANLTRPGFLTLYWSISNASRALIDQGVGVIEPVAEGSRSVSASQSTTYTLTAKGAGGEVTCRTAVIVAELQDFPPKQETPRTARVLMWASAAALLIFAFLLIPGDDRPQVPVSTTSSTQEGTALAPENNPSSSEVPARSIERFVEARTMIVMPPPGYEVVHEHKDADENSSATMVLNRGTRVLAIGRVVDAGGNGWIEISDEGFVKENYLVPDAARPDGQSEEQQSVLSPHEPRESKSRPLQNSEPLGVIVGSVSRYDSTWNCLILQLTSSQVVEGGTVFIELPDAPLKARVESVNGSKACAEPATIPPVDVAGKLVRLALNEEQQ